MCLHSKQSSLFSFYALPSGGKSKDEVVIKKEISFKSFLSSILANLKKIAVNMQEQGWL